MPALRLKTKLVFAITAMVLAIVATLSTVYVSQVVHQRIHEAYVDADFIAHEVFSVAQDALETDLSNSRIDLSDPQQVGDSIQEALQTDAGLDALLQYIQGYSPIILDAAIVDAHGRALLHTTEAFTGKVIKTRPDFASIDRGGIWKQIKMLYGPLQEYDVRISLARCGQPFSEVRVGITNVFLKKELQPLLNHALIFSGLAILISMVLAAGLSNFALRPLEAINRRLDQISSGQVEAVEAKPARSDEYGAVTSKIDRLGRQMRDVKEVFSALKENLDQMMANLQDGVMLFTSDFKAVMVSASAERFIGKPRSEMLGSYPTDIFSQDSRLGEVILEALAIRNPINQEEFAGEYGRQWETSLDLLEER